MALQSQFLCPEICCQIHYIEISEGWVIGSRCPAFARSASQLVVARRVGAPKCKGHMRATVTLPWWDSDKATSSWNISQDDHPSCFVHMAATRIFGPDKCWPNHDLLWFFVEDQWSIRRRLSSRRIVMLWARTWWGAWRAVPRFAHWIVCPPCE